VRRKTCHSCIFFPKGSCTHPRRGPIRHAYDLAAPVLGDGDFGDTTLIRCARTRTSHKIRSKSYSLPHLHTTITKILDFGQSISSIQRQHVSLSKHMTLYNHYKNWDNFGRRNTNENKPTTYEINYFHQFSLVFVGFELQTNSQK